MTLYTYCPGGTKVSVMDAWSHCKMLGIPECFTIVKHTLKCESDRKPEMQQTGKSHAFILLFAISGMLAEIKFYSSLPEAMMGPLVFQGFSKFS